MFSVEWRHGRQVLPIGLADELGNAIRAEAIDKLKQTVARVRCPVHGGNVREAPGSSRDRTGVNRRRIA
jgi:hypothetical protein